MKEKIKLIIENAISELNEEIEYDTLANLTDETVLFGGEDGIDSISLARLISDIELALGDSFKATVILADEKAMSMRQSPYRTVGTLTEFVISRMAVSNE